MSRSQPDEARRQQPLIVRPSRSDEITVLAELAARWFSDAFAKDNTPEDLEAYLSTAMTPEKFEEEFADENSLFLIAESDNEVVGYARLRFLARSDAIEASAPVELHRLYAAGDRKGAGIGSALLKECCKQSVERGCDVMWLGVWEHNPSAIAFYERKGFRTVGGHQFLLGASVQNDRIMQRALKAGDT